MRYKHKFYLINELMDGKKVELAICSDENTANFLASHYRETYKEAMGLAVMYCYGKEKRVILYPRMPENKK